MSFSWFAVLFYFFPERGVCLPTVSLWILFVYIEAAIRFKDLKNFHVDLCRPFAAHWWATLCCFYLFILFYSKSCGNLTLSCVPWMQGMLGLVLTMNMSAWCRGIKWCKDYIQESFTTLNWSYFFGVHDFLLFDHIYCKSIQCPVNWKFVHLRLCHCASRNCCDIVKKICFHQLAINFQKTLKIWTVWCVRN